MPQTLTGVPRPSLFFFALAEWSLHILLATEKDQNLHVGAAVQLAQHSAAE